MDKIVALVPMRHTSERVKSKNYRLFGDKPLYHHIVTSLLECPEISQVVIDTDSPFIFEDGAKFFPQVKFLERPSHLRDGKVSMNDVLLHDVTKIEAEFYLQVHSTTPLLRSETISKALREFLNNYPIYDSLFTVTRLQTRLWDGLTRAVNHNPAILLRTQDLPPIFEENSNIYIFTKDILQSLHNRIGHRPLMFEIEKAEAWDIDEELDFKVTEFLYYEQRRSK